MGHATHCFSARVWPDRDEDMIDVKCRTGIPNDVQFTVRLIKGLHVWLRAVDIY